MRNALRALVQRHALPLEAQTHILTDGRNFIVDLASNAGIADQSFTALADDPDLPYEAAYELMLNPALAESNLTDAQILTVIGRAQRWEDKLSLHDWATAIVYQRPSLTIVLDDLERPYDTVAYAALVQPGIALTGDHIRQSVHETFDTYHAVIAEAFPWYSPWEGRDRPAGGPRWAKYASTHRLRDLESRRDINAAMRRVDKWGAMERSGRANLALIDLMHNPHLTDDQRAAIDAHTSRFNRPWDRLLPGADNRNPDRLPHGAHGLGWREANTLSEALGDPTEWVLALSLTDAGFNGTTAELLDTIARLTVTPTNI